MIRQLLNNSKDFILILWNFALSFIGINKNKLETVLIILSIILTLIRLIDLAVKFFKKRKKVHDKKH